MDENTESPTAPSSENGLADTAAAEDSTPPSPLPTDEDATATPAPASQLLDRPRPPRPPFVPAWAPLAIILAVTAVVLVGGALLYSNFLGRVQVPNVTGVEVGVATARLAQDKLDLVVAARHFSPKPANTILSQSPAPGTQIRHGQSVSVVVSAGTEEFALPDVTGDGLLLARGILETKGLELHVEVQPSDQPSDTVLSTNPSPGALVRTGDIVTVSVAATGPASGILLPYNMRGVRVDLDPAPATGSEPDVTLDVARRLQSLIEASGGSVVTLRALADTGTAAEPPARAARAQGTRANVAIGFSVAQSGSSGMIALAPGAGSSQIVIPSKILASDVASELAAAGQVAKASTVATDVVLGATKAPWTRVQLGSFGSKDDQAKFTDPNWADTVARAIYRAVAALYGKKTPAS